MDFKIKLQDDVYLITSDDYPGFSHYIINTEIPLDDVEKLVSESLEYLIDQYQKNAIESIRNKRIVEFSKYDKYQLALVWGELNEEQQTEYIKWRNDWLNATISLIEPVRPNWFAE